MNIQKTLWLLIGFILLVCALAFIKLTSRSQQQTIVLENHEFQHATITNAENDLPDLHLTNHKGEQINNDSFKGQWTLLFFGYTSCPDICPTTMAMLTTTVEYLSAKDREKLQVMMVSVDPERDTAEKLAQYVPFFNQDFIGITGDAEQLKKFSFSLGGIFDKRENKDDPENYLVDHTSKIFLLNREARRRATFSTNVKGVFDPQQLAEELSVIMQADDSKL